MRFEEAREQLRTIANGSFAAIEYCENQHKSGDKPRVRLYIETVGYTEQYTTWDEAFNAMGRLLRGEPESYEGPEDEFEAFAS